MYPVGTLVTINAYEIPSIHGAVGKITCGRGNPGGVECVYMVHIINRGELLQASHRYTWIEEKYLNTGFAVDILELDGVDPY